MQPEPKKHVSHAIAWSIIILLSGSLAIGIWVYVNQISSIYDDTVIYSIPHNKTSSKPTTATGPIVDWETYTNDTYGFSFEYPSEWATTKAESTKSGDGDTQDILFKVIFSNPQRVKDMQISNCLSNEQVNWSNPAPTKEECTDILSGLTTTQRTELNTRMDPKNLFVRVMKYDPNSASLKDWLVKEYKKPNTELEDYDVGKVIKMGGIDGFVSSIGCCSGTDVSYVIQKGDYVYMLGTNDSSGKTGESRAEADDAFIQKIAPTFLFAK